MRDKVSQAMFTLYGIGFWSASKVVPVQCEQELMFCCRAETVSKRFQCEGALSIIHFAMLSFDLKRLFTKTRFRCNFCSDKRVQT